MEKKVEQMNAPRGPRYASRVSCILTADPDPFLTLPGVDLDADRSWERFRRRYLLHRVLHPVRCARGLLSFQKASTRLSLGPGRYLGTRVIELKRVRGSVGRGGDFTIGFLPRKKSIEQRWKSMWKRMLAGGLPPIEVYQVGGTYFVADGHHRVSVAMQLGMKTLEAYVYEFPGPS
ncbi:MAG: ParB/RepB/Spo0J family partition protein [Spirochaetota bacterium]